MVDPGRNSVHEDLLLASSLVKAVLAKKVPQPRSAVQARLPFAWDKSQLPETLLQPLFLLVTETLPHANNVATVEPLLPQTRRTAQLAAQRVILVDHSPSERDVLQGEDA